MRIFVTIVLLSFCAGGIGFLFWNQELKYALPTPVPLGYKIVPVKEVINLSDRLGLIAPRAIYLHFFNPECPCSRFNIKHFNNLTSQLKGSIKVYAVIPAGADLNWAKKLVKNEIEVIEDKGDALAKSCGVYSTPQAVIIDKEHRLYYRGNYNKNRYCTQRSTNYVEIALAALIKGEQPPSFGPLATQSYGCQLPSDEITF